MLKTILLLTLIASIATSALAGTYTAAVLYKLTSEDADCSPDEDLLQDIAEMALATAGLRVAGQSDQWMATHSRNNNANENAAAAAKNGGDNRALVEQQKKDAFRALLTSATPGHRQLGCRRNDCDRMCSWTGQAYYCACCACCGGRRRRTQHLFRRLQKTRDVDLSVIEADAAVEAIQLLEEQSTSPACLDPAFDVVVRIQDDNASDNANAASGLGSENGNGNGPPRADDGSDIIDGASGAVPPRHMATFLGSVGVYLMML